MSTSNLESPIFCGQCGTKLLPNKTCSNTECSAYGGRSSPSYTLTEPAISPRGLQQSSITPKLSDPAWYAPTQPTYTPLPPPRSVKNKIYLIVVPLLVLILLSLGILVGIQLGKSNQQGTTSNTLGSRNQSGTLPTNVNTAVTNVAPSPTPSPTATPMPIPGTILYQENGSDNWKGWALSSDWRVVSQGLLISTGSPNKPSAVAPYSIQGISNFAVETVIELPEGWTSGFTGVGITACGSTQGDWQGYVGGLSSDSWGPYAEITRTNTQLGYLRLDPGKVKHMFRFEIRGNALTLLIDNAAVVHVSDDTYLQCGPQLGLWNSQGVAHVSSFKVIAL